MEINKKIIKELKDCLDEFDLNEIEYSYKDTKIKVSNKVSSEVVTKSNSKDVKQVHQLKQKKKRLVTKLILQ